MPGRAHGQEEEEEEKGGNVAAMGRAAAGLPSASSSTRTFSTNARRCFRGVLPMQPRGGGSVEGANIPRPQAWRSRVKCR